MTEKIVIIGAGAAGIGAGLALQALAVPFVILEASDRVGGRAYTDKTSFTTHWDQGCSWLHCADINPLVSWADKLGAVYENEDHSEKALFWSENHWLDMPERSSVHRHITNRFASIYATAKQGHDVPISAIPDHDGIGAVIAKTMVQLMCSDEPERASAAGYADYIDTNVNWVVTSGYGDLINRMAVGLPIRRGTEVSAITYRRDGVSLQTNSGQIDARAAIVTTSTNVLRSGKIDLPSGPVQKLLNLIEEVPCGTYEKIAIAEGEAIAIEQVFNAIHKGNPSNDLIAIKYLESLEKIADGNATKIFLPAELSATLGSIGAISELFKEDKEESEKLSDE